MKSGILAIWHDMVPEHTGEILDWYDKEHHFERLGVPGFRSVRRYEAAEGTSPKLFIRYETDSPEVLSSAPYLERLNNPTPWTLRCQPQFRNNSRTVCERVEASGRAEGGVALTVRLFGDRSADAWRPIVQAASKISGILGWEYWIADFERSTIPTHEKRLRGGEDHYVKSVIILHVRGSGAARKCCSALENSLGEVSDRRMEIGMYHLSFAA